ncbi:hypothetical protein ACYOEI_20160, partial [Singulisphaera rosea]
MKTLRLEHEVPIPGVVRDEQGRPISGVTPRPNSRYAESPDIAGRFTLYGQGPDLYAFLDASRVVTWASIRTGNGSSVVFAGMIIADVTDRASRPGRNSSSWSHRPGLMVTPSSTIQASRFVRIGSYCAKSTVSPAVKFKGDQIPRLEQLEPGRFRFAYDTPAEYHLGLQAPGYQEAEAFTPKMTRRSTITGFDVKMKKGREGPNPSCPTRRRSGFVARDGR